MTKDHAHLLDAYLVASARAGSREAFERLVTNWHPRLLAHAVRLTGEREIARDAVQVAWGEIVRGLGGLRDEQAFAAWAYRIVSRSCAGEIKGKVRRRELAAAVKQEPQQTFTEPVEPGDGSALRRAIRALPPGERAAIALYHFEEMSVAQTAVALNVPVGTAKTRLMNARRKLRTLLEGAMQ